MTAGTIDASSDSLEGRETKSSDVAGTPVALSIIIAAYNTRKLLSDCLDSIAASKLRERYEIIVIDDASTDGSYEMVEADWPEVILLRNPVNKHYAYSNNRGLSLASGEFILLLNSDTIVKPHALDDMVDFLRRHPDAGVVGCKLLNEDGSVQWSVKTLPSAQSALFGARSVLTRLLPTNVQSRKHLLHIDGSKTEPFKVDGYVSSACCIVPRHVVEEVGHLDLRLAYHVDADYCKRITNAGYACYYLPSPTIIHLNHQGGTLASRKARLRSLVLFETQSFTFFRTHYRRSKYDPLQIVAATGLMAHFVVSLTALIGREMTSTRSAASKRSLRSVEKAEL